MIIGQTALVDTLLAMGMNKSSAWGAKKIKEAVEKNSHKSFETMLYQVIVESLNQVSAGRFKGEDCIYDAASSFMNDWSIAGHLDVNVCRKCLVCISEENREEEFLKLLITKISETDVLKDHFVVDGIAKIESTTRDNYNLSEEILSEVKSLRVSTTNIQVSEVKPDNIDGSKFAAHKKYYIDKWRGRLFLHTRDCDRPLTLEEAFIFPSYYIDNKKEKDYDNLEELLNNFIAGHDRTMLLLGYPGIGKTSIASYLANKYKDDEDVLIIRLQKIKNDPLILYCRLLRAICEELKCTEDYLQGKTLILDGFDEINCGNSRQEILEKFFLDIKDVDSLKVLITSREGYINCGNIIINHVIHIIPFDINKIKRFYKFMFGKDFPNITIDNHKVLGIPVILYMALSVGVHIEDGGSKAELYERIFALKGGIFDRFESSKNNAYESGKHLIQDIKKEFKVILQKTALQIFIKKEAPLTNKRLSQGLCKHSN